MTTSIVDTEPRTRVKDRGVICEWDLGPTTDHYGDPATLVAVLSVWHRTNKSFVADIYNMTIRDNVAAGDPYDSVRIATRPVARFSARALADFAGEALAGLRARKDEPAIARYLVNPSATEQAA